MTTVKVRHPGLLVILRKNVGRSTVDGKSPVSERFAGQQRSIDLTPYIGEHGAVRVSKSTREAAGGFVITFADRINPDAQDTMYGLIEPMDVIEIRMAGDAYSHPRPVTTGPQAPRQLPIMMRGLVSEVTRSEGITSTGQPQRSVTVTGQDYGKIWQILQIFNNPYVAPEANLITSFPFFARFGLTFNTMPAEKFVREVFDKVINPYIKNMRSIGGADESASPLLTIDTSGIQISDGMVSPFGIGGWAGGTVYSLLAEHADVGPWNELYIDDIEAGPVVVYRPNPFMTADGSEYIVPLTEEPDIVNITREDVVTMTASRSDADVANYFWVDAPRFNMNYTETLRAYAYQADPADVYDNKYGNNNPYLYGTRRMSEQTQQGGRGETNNGNGTPNGSERTVNESELTGWILKRLKQLKAKNRDNVVFEKGAMRLKGNEAIRAGVYVRLEHGNMVSDYYAVSVQHDYVPFGSYTTTVNFERGTGFIDRVRQEGGASSPYWSELNRKSR